VVLAAVDVEALATPAKLAAACGAGFALALLLDAGRQLVVIALAALVADVASVLAGPTKVLGEDAPGALSATALHLPAWGEGGTILVGLVDAVFLALFTAGAVRLGLRPLPSLVALVAALAVSAIAAAALDRALPAVPLMAIALIGVNADRILRRGGGISPSERESAAGRDIRRPG
jgi:hypothetical protein